MAGQNRVGGTIFLRIDGVLYDCKGNFTYNLGQPKRDTVIGAAGVHGYTEKTQAGFIEGEITDNRNLSLKTLVTSEDVTIQLDLANGKRIVGSQAWFAGEGTGNTDEGNIGVRFESRTPFVEMGA